MPDLYALSDKSVFIQGASRRIEYDVRLRFAQVRAEKRSNVLLIPFNVRKDRANPVDHDAAAALPGG